METTPSSPRFRSLCALALLAAAPAAIAQPVPPNDGCANAIPIAGPGPFAFDLTGATTGPQGQNNPNCNFFGTAGITNDLWWCWTADCDGLAVFSTCGQAMIDTKVAIYIGCACPLAPTVAFVCNDDSCGLQSQVSFEVRCGQQYLIQLGNFPGAAPGTGTFTVTCDGDPCKDPEPIPGECCGGRPRFDDDRFRAFFPGGTVAVTTYDPMPPGDPFVMGVHDLADYPNNNPSAPPINAPAGFENWPGYSPIFRHASWTKPNMGTIFGTTLDADGNIYTAHTSLYPFSDATGSLGGAGSVYRMDAVTGQAAEYIRLPNTLDPDANIGGPSERLPGLGNLDYDCRNEQLFVTNHDDGRIYRIEEDSANPGTGVVVSTFDHATGTILSGPLSGLPEVGDAPGWARLGERLWGVQVHAGRVYYAVWSQDAGNDPGVGPNTIRSIALDANGEFIGVSVLEVVLPSLPNGPTYSNPVADIQFGPTGSMLLGERGMFGPTISTPHQARALEFTGASQNWSPSANTFSIGVIPPSSSAGGVAYDYAAGGRVWVMGDALKLDQNGAIYGLQGLPASGGTVANSILIDVDGDGMSGGQDKDDLGDVEISCAGQACAEITEVEILCDIGPDGTTGNYTLTFTVTNNSGVPVEYILLPNSQTSPHVIPLSIPVGGSAPVTINLTGVDPNTTFCFSLTLADAKVEECCTVDVCVDIPECDCLQIIDEVIACDPALPGVFTWQIDLQNLTPDMVEHVFFIPPAGVTVTPDYFDIPTLAPFATASLPPVTISGAVPGTQLCIRITIHDQRLFECCSQVVCITVPDCPIPAIPGDPPCTPDWNGDGVVNSNDFFAFLDAFFAGYGDFNKDTVTNSNDFFSFLAAYFEGC